MGQDPESRPHHRRMPRPIVLAVASVASLAVTVALTRTGVDLLLIVAVCGVALIVERSLGDWMGELVGPGPASLVIAGCVLLGVWYLLTGDDKTRAQYFLDRAEQRGYHSLYFESESSRAAPSGSAGAHSARTAGTSTPNRDRPSFSMPSIASRSPAAARSPSSSPTSPTRPSAGPQPTGSAGKVHGGGSVTGDGIHRGSRNVLPGSTTALMLTPPIAVVGQTIEARSIVSTGGGPVADGSIEFAVNGRRIALVLLGSTNKAMARFTPRAPGTYTVRAQFSGNESLSGSSTIAVLTVVPDK
jgi:hypothetical protein